MTANEPSRIEALAACERREEPNPKAKKMTVLVRAKISGPKTRISETATTGLEEDFARRENETEASIGPAFQPFEERAGRTQS